jgi:hypothetical protein
MRPEPPMQLRHHGVLVGSIVSYGYETPWATGQIDPADPALYACLVEVDAFLQWVDALPDDLPDAEADARYAAELARRGLTEECVRGYGSGWSITTRDGREHEVYTVICDADRFVTWRW